MTLITLQLNRFGSRLSTAFACFLFASLYLPVMMLWSGIIPFHYRFAVIFWGIAAMITYTVVRKLNWSDLGFRRDTLAKSLLWNTGISLLFLSILYLLHSAGLIGTASARLWPFFLIFYILILSPAQELFFRSILFAEWKRIKPNAPWGIIMFSALSFCFLHIIYQCPTMIAVTLLMGIVWGAIYYRYPNFWGVALSHAVLGTAAFATGLI